MLLGLYRTTVRLATPLINKALEKRALRGKEDVSRMAERRGDATAPRPSGRLIWVHAASVGEATSALVLIECLVAKGHADHVMLTTGTVTSAEIAEKRLPAKAFHQYCPIDHPKWVARFLDHWAPDAAIWIEGEIWPNLVAETRARKIPMALVNARLSQKSIQNWTRFNSLFRHLVGSFDPVLCQTDEMAKSFQSLGISHARCVGNLKYSAHPLPVDPDALDHLTGQIGARPFYAAASTHPGEEELIAAAHTALAAAHEGFLTLLIPRHPARAPEIEALLRERGLSVARRSLGQEIAEGTDIYLADTLGELGLFYAASDIIYLGGGMGSLGGHNPIEACQLDCAVFYGPDRGNFSSVTSALEIAGATSVVHSSTEIATTVSALLEDAADRSRRIASGRHVAKENADVINRVLDELTGLKGRDASAGEPA